MSGTVGVADADHRWLARLLAGDPLACELLDLARKLPDPEWDAFARHVEWIQAGAPSADPVRLGA